MKNEIQSIKGLLATTMVYLYDCQSALLSELHDSMYKVRESDENLKDEDSLGKSRLKFLPEIMETVNRLTEVDSCIGEVMNFESNEKYRLHLMTTLTGIPIDFEDDSRAIGRKDEIEMMKSSMADKIRQIPGFENFNFSYYEDDDASDADDDDETPNDDKIECDGNCNDCHVFINNSKNDTDDDKPSDPPKNNESDSSSGDDIIDKIVAIIDGFADVSNEEKQRRFEDFKKLYETFVE